MKLLKRFKLVNNLKINNEKISKILEILLVVAIFLIPFDNLPYAKNILGELSYRGAVYPFIIIILINFGYTIKNKEIYLPKGKEWKFIFVFLVITVISCLFNAQSILNNSFKGRSGINKLILQFMVIIFMVLVLYTSEIIIKIRNIKLKNLRKYIMYSLIPVLIYGFLELLNMSKILDLSWILNKISYLIHTYSRGEFYVKGIRSVTGEVSYFAMYSSFALPWIASYIFTEKITKNKICYSIITMSLLVLMVFSKSRTSYIIIITQIFMFVIFLMICNTNIKYKITVIRSTAICIMIFIVINSTVLSAVGGDINSVKSFSIKGVVTSLLDSNNMSNIARVGLQGAALNIAIKNPILGTGLGQYGFHVKGNLSEKALTSLEVQNWMNPEIDIWPPAFSLYSRMVAEQGFVGGIFWIVFLLYLVIKLLKKVRKCKDDILGIALLVSFIGVLISWWNADTYGQLSFWILLPFVISYSNSEFKEDEISNNEEVVFNGN